MGKTISAIILLILLSSVLYGKGVMGKKYDWLPTECADERFPMEIVSGDFFFKNSGGIYIPDGKIIDNGWGSIGSSHLVGDNYKPLPNKLAVQWFSYLENKFYSGKFDLPYDKISRLFEEGLTAPANGKHETYHYIIVGLGSKGEIFVWLAGAGLVREAAHFRAKEADVDWKRINDNPKFTREELVSLRLGRRFTSDQISQARKDLGQKNFWQRYKIKYNWNLEIIGNAKPLYMWIKTFNGESEYIDFSNNSFEENRARSLPKHIDLSWHATSGSNYSTEFFFNGDETIKAFHKLSELNPDDRFTLQIEIDSISKHSKVHLMNSKYTIDMEHIKTEVKKYAQ